MVLDAVKAVPTLQQLVQDAHPLPSPSPSRKRRGSISSPSGSQAKSARVGEAPSHIHVLPSILQVAQSAASAITTNSVQQPEPPAPMAVEAPTLGRADPPVNPVTNIVNPPVTPHLDRLGTLLAKCTTMLADSPSWEAFVKKVHGPSSLQEGMQHLPHPAGEFLASLHQHGVPCVQSDEDWTLELLDARMERGCHRSANEHKEFIRDEMADFVEGGFYAVLPYRVVRHLPGLRLSPLGIKEERDRRARLVVDHSHYLVNLHTMAHAPKEAMQFGGALYRVLYKLFHADPRFGPAWLAKYDVKDGFYRMMLRALHALGLTVILPRYEGEEPMVAVPLVLTMGWVNSPPIFCAMSETACDIANARMYRRFAPPHRLEALAATHDALPQD